MKKNQKFSGNFLYQSVNAFKGLTLSRRDDLISLAYLLIDYFNGNQLWVNSLDKTKPFYEQVHAIKLAQTPSGLTIGKAALLSPFVKEVFAYNFAD